MTTTPPPPTGPPSDVYTVAQPPLSASEEKMWATLTHVGGILFGWVVPLVTYVLFKDRGPFVRAHTTTALNFQLTMIIFWIVGGLLSVILIGIFILMAAAAVVLIFSIMAAVAANDGKYYKYPLAITFVR